MCRPSSAFGVISACYTNLAIALSFRRDSGVLKRVRGTPLPPWVFMAGNIGSSLIVSALLVALTTLAGVLFYGVVFPGRWVALVLTLAVGAFCFCALGLAMTTVIPTATASPAIVNGVLFPILFISGTFFPHFADGRPRAESPACSPSATSSRPCSPCSTRGRPRASTRCRCS